MAPDADPDFYLMRMMIRIRIQDTKLTKLMRIRIHNTQCNLYAPLEDDVVGLREQLHQVVNLCDVHAGVDPMELELAPQHSAYLLALPQPPHQLEFNKA